VIGSALGTTGQPAQQRFRTADKGPVTGCPSSTTRVQVPALGRTWNPAATLNGRRLVTLSRTVERETMAAWLDDGM
jgi:hypothetical protein